MLWKNNGPYVANGWYTSVDSAEWKSDEYCFRTATAKSNLFQNWPEDTHYFFTDTDSKGVALSGENRYSITFNGQMPSAKGPVSITLYTENHFLYQCPYSVKLDNLVGTQVFFAGPDQGMFPDKRWMATPPNEPFSLYLRVYWMDKMKLWVLPEIQKMS